MIENRFKTYFIGDFDIEKFLSIKEVRALYETIQKTITRDITFRIFIKEFEKRGMIINGKIQFNIYPEKDILHTIYEILNKKQHLFSILKDIKDKTRNSPELFEKNQEVLSLIYDKKGISLKSSYCEDYSPIFKLLLKRKLIKIMPGEKNGIGRYHLDQELFSLFMNIEKRVKFLPLHYLKSIVYEEEVTMDDVSEKGTIIDTLNRIIGSTPFYKEKLEKIRGSAQNEYLDLVDEIELDNKFKINKNSLEKMDNTIFLLLRFIYEISGETYEYDDKEELFKIFRYTWLSSNEFQLYCSGRDNFLKSNRSKEVSQQFLNTYINAYKHHIYKIERHIKYNNFLQIGSRDLSDNEKVVLNKARWALSANRYEDCVNTFSDLMEDKLRIFIFNILELKFGINWYEHLPSITKSKIKRYKQKDKDNYQKVVMKQGSRNVLYHLGRADYHHIILDDELWNSCFKKILGSNNRNILRDIEVISKTDHLSKHKRDDGNLEIISFNIRKNLETTKEILQIINRSYQVLLDANSTHINNQTFYFFVKKGNISNSEPIIISMEKQIKILEILKDILNKEDKFRDHYIDVEDRDFIQNTFNLYYVDVLAIFGKLIKEKVMKIKDCEGPKILFELI
ncbi:MAG: hypothetical protein ACFFCS_26720 [Candidatus Hodarchaeota archaeon]